MIRKLFLATAVAICALRDGQLARAQTATNTKTLANVSISVDGSLRITKATTNECPNANPPTAILATTQILKGPVNFESICHASDIVPATCAVFQASLQCEQRMSDWRGSHTGTFKLICAGQVIGSGTMNGLNGDPCNQFQGMIRGSLKLGGSNAPVQASYMGSLNQVHCPTQNPPKGPFHMRVDGVQSVPRCINCDAASTITYAISGPWVNAVGVPGNCGASPYIAVDPNNLRNVVMNQAGFRYSNDGGISFSVPTFFNGLVDGWGQVMADVYHTGVFYATFLLDGQIDPSPAILKSTDGGASWHTYGNLPGTGPYDYMRRSEIQISTTQSGRIFVGYYRGYAYSDNDGASWTIVDLSSQIPSGTKWTNVTVSHDAQRIWVSVAANGVLKSTNGGASFVWDSTLHSQ